MGMCFANTAFERVRGDECFVVHHVTVLHSILVRAKDYPVYESRAEQNACCGPGESSLHTVKSYRAQHDEYYTERGCVQWIHLVQTQKHSFLAQCKSREKSTEFTGDQKILRWFKRKTCKTETTHLTVWDMSCCLSSCMPPHDCSFVSTGSEHTTTNQKEAYCRANAKREFICCSKESLQPHLCLFKAVLTHVKASIMHHHSSCICHCF